MFIESFESSVPEEFCVRAVDWARSAPDRAPAEVAPGRRDDARKLSWDSTLNSHPELWREYKGYLNLCLIDYCRRWPFDRYNKPVEMEWPTMLQQYPPGGGYLRLHSEAVGPETADRVLAYMTYLTDHDQGGGTEFPLQNLTVQSRRARTVIWPAGWTHIHRSEPTQDEKIIITGWFRYMR